MNDIRYERLAEQINRELLLIFSSEMRDPRMINVKINDTRLSKDYNTVRVYYTDNSSNLHKALVKASPYIRCLIAKSLSCYKIPKIEFIFDEASIKIDKLLSLIDDIKSE